MNSLTHWDPFKELNRLSTILGSGKPALAQAEHREWAPAVDISEDDESFIIKADLPDVDKDDVNVTVQNGYLTLSGERRMEKEEEDKKKKYHRIERSYGSYTRSFALPENVDGGAVKAKFKDGVLHIVLPKVAPEESHSKVEIEID
ncbi:MAG: Hsp20/alpha crystallin family protein [Verrucomicrobiales bacterium]|nr:Hsp20/alpha crystallin family protein [Verrucomicrobiales bacterium]